MPNWCNNYIVITPSDEDKKLKKFNKFKKRFEVIISSNEPVCESLIGVRELPNNYHQDGWYNYNINRFGTKWDFTIDRGCETISNKQISFSVETAWSPPIPFLVEMCEEWGVCAKIEYEEGGCDFAGITSISPDGIYDELEYSGVDEYQYHHCDSFWDNVCDYAYECETLEELTDRYSFIQDDVGLAELKRLFDEAQLELRKQEDEKNKQGVV